MMLSRASSDRESGKMTFASEYLSVSEKNLKVESILKENDAFAASEYESYADGLQKYKTMATAFHNQDRLDEAIAMYKKTLDIQLKVYDSDHMDIAKTYKNMARALAKQGKQKESMKMLQQAFGIYCRVLGPDHSTTEQTKELMEWMRNEADFQATSSGATRPKGNPGRRRSEPPRSGDDGNCIIS